MRNLNRNTSRKRFRLNDHPDYRPQSDLRFSHTDSFPWKHLRKTFKTLGKTKRILFQSLLSVFGTDWITRNESGFDGAVFVHMLKEHCLADGWFVMNSFATVTISAGSYFVKEWTVDFVHFRAVHFGESLGHFQIKKL